MYLYLNGTHPRLISGAHHNISNIPTSKNVLIVLVKDVNAKESIYEAQITVHSSVSTQILLFFAMLNMWNLIKFRIWLGNQ
jgi:hypothetical protein